MLKWRRDDDPCYGDMDSKDLTISSLNGRVADLEEMNEKAKRANNHCLICLVNKSNSNLLFKKINK